MSNEEVQEREFSGFSGGGSYDGPLEDNRVYPATVAAIMERNIEQGQWPGWKVIWTFAIEGKSHTEMVEAMTSTATGDSSKAGPWLIALVGKARYEERSSSPITKEELVGRECSILVQFSDRGWPRVTSVLPRSNGSAPRPAPVPREPANVAADFDNLPF